MNGLHPAWCGTVVGDAALKDTAWTAPDGQNQAGLTCSAWTVQPLGAISRRAPHHQPDQVQPALHSVAYRGHVMKADRWKPLEIAR
jgi:hypothetical protein